MAAEDPRVEPRAFAEFVRDTRRMIRRELDLAQPAPGDDPPVPGDGLVHIFARLAEIVADHVNRVPEKNLLAFLSMLGLDQTPPRAARVPLTFRLASGATRARVPAATEAVAVAAEGESEPPVFETERELTLTSTELVAAFVREPALDRYRDASAVLAPEGTDVAAFAGELPIAHELFVADALIALPQPKVVTIHVGPWQPAHPWPYALAWSYHDGTRWRSVAPQITGDIKTGAWHLRFVALPGVAATTVGARTQPWLRAQLTTSLPAPQPLDGRDPPDGVLQQAGLALDGAARDESRLDVRAPLAPFGRHVAAKAFTVACERAFSKPGAKVALSVSVDGAQPATPSADLELTWSVFDGKQWRVLGKSSPSSSKLVPKSTLVDGTRAFTQDGVIELTAAPDWSAREIDGTSALWLKAERTLGGFGLGPTITAVTVRYGWPAPEVQLLTHEVEIDRKGLAPDAAYFGDQPLDLSKDFKPFGDMPRFNDVFYVACDEAFSLPGARIELKLSGTKQVGNAGDPKVVWEAFDAASGRWKAQVVSDESFGLTFSNEKVTGLDATIVLTMPAAPAAARVAGEERHWLRARLVGGDYGRDATVTTDNNKLTVSAATWAPPSLRALSIDYTFHASPETPDAILGRNDFRIAAPSQPPAPGHPFAPFAVTQDRRPTFYLAASADFANEPTALFLDVVAPTYGAGEAAGNGGPPAVVWEYRSADGWRSLGTRDETRSFAGRGLLSFVAPADMATWTEFGIAACWLRARWDRGSYRIAPRLARVLTNTTWASHVTTVRGEILGSGTGEERQRFPTVRAPILPGQRIEVREQGSLSPGEVAAIIAEEGADAVTTASADGSAETWVRWHPVVDFYASDSRSRHYVVDRLSGEVRFGDGRRGRAAPPGRANIRASLYRSGGGANGNRPAAAITELTSSVPYVDGVSNPVAAVGGADALALAAVRAHGARLLRHGNRAVTIGDLEDLALEASPDVAHVLGLPATSASSGGSVGVVVVPGGDARQPLPSLELLDQVRIHLEQRLPLNAEVWVAGPGWIEISVTAEVVPAVLEEATDVRNAVRARLDAVLHPLAQSPAAGPRPFGRTPRRSDLLAVVETLPGVDHVRELTIAQVRTAPEPAPGAVLAYSGEHTITLAGSTDDPRP